MNEIRLSTEVVNDLVKKTTRAAEAYNLAAQTLGGSGPGNPATNKLASPGDDEVIGAWVNMRDDVYRVLAGSAKNLAAVARLVITTAEDLGAQDGSNAKQLDAIKDLESKIAPGRPWKQ